MITDYYFSKILLGGSISTAFQPIISLESGNVFGYEALSRISIPACEINIEELFEVARRQNQLWELEKLCRTKALQSALSQKLKHLLFLNVDASTISDPTFHAGFTVEKLQEYGIKADNVVIEITEKTAIYDVNNFISSVQHYQKQGFQIAIDDFGSGYSGLNRVCSLHPKFVKIDIKLVRDIHKHPIKYSAVSSVVDFCQQMGIQVIAEGIETEDELKAIIQLGIDYGQGYYLCRPNPIFQDIDFNLKQQICDFFNKTKIQCQLLGSKTIGNFSEHGETILITSTSLPIYERLRQNSELAELFVLDDEEKVCGIIPRHHALEQYGGLYGYNLSKKKHVDALMIKEVLVVNEHMPIEEVSRLAMQRSKLRVYDSIAVMRNNKYLGKVTVQDLLLASIQTQLQRAKDSSPLTGLPGNYEIQRKINATFHMSEPWAIVYLDIDNFKAYNDAYGFVNGDLMIRALAESMRYCASVNDFLGHIGGDDFVLITHSHEAKDLCQNIVCEFHSAIKPIYSSIDWGRGYIISKDRNGFIQKFLIASLSVAVVTNQMHNLQTINDLSILIAQTKKKCKQLEGDTILIV